MILSVWCCLDKSSDGLYKEKSKVPNGSIESMMNGENKCNVMPKTQQRQKNNAAKTTNSLG